MRLSRARPFASLPVHQRARREPLSDGHHGVVVLEGPDRGPLASTATGRPRPGRAPTATPTPTLQRAARQQPGHARPRRRRSARPSPRPRRPTSGPPSGTRSRGSRRGTAGGWPRRHQVQAARRQPAPASRARSRGVPGGALVDAGVDRARGPAPPARRGPGSGRRVAARCRRRGATSSSEPITSHRTSTRSAGAALAPAVEEAEAARDRQRRDRPHPREEVVDDREPRRRSRNAFTV